MKGAYAKQNNGFSTIEMLVAFAILALGFTGLITVVFGNDNFAIDAYLNNRAVSIAEKNLNEGRARTENDFLGFAGFSGSEDGGRYETEVEITGLTPCKNLITSTARWSPTILRQQSVSLQTAVASIEELLKLGSDCADEPSGDDWKYPSSLASQDFDPGGIPATNIDWIDGYAYLTSNSSPEAKNDLWIVNTSNPDPLSLYVEGQLNTGGGLFDVDVAGDYAYAAANATSGQLLVIDTDANDDGYKDDPEVVATRDLNGIDTGGSYPQGRTVFYYNGRVYVGTRETAGPEFHIFDVSSPTNPTHVGARELNHTVRDIFVKGDYAFIANSGDQNELIVLNVSSPGAITPSFPGVGQPEPWRFDAEGGEDGTAIYTLGGKAYLGRKRTPEARPNFYILDIGNPESPSMLGASSTVLNPNTETTGILASGHLAFFSSTNQTAGFQIWDISNPSNPVPWPDCNIQDYNNSEKAVGLDFDGEYIYVANESQNALRVFWSNTDGVCEK